MPARSARRAFVLALLLIGALTGTAAAQGTARSPVQPPPPSDFMLGRPKGFLAVDGGFLFANAGSDVYDFVTKQLTLDHTHYDTIPGCEAATALYGRVFKPTIHREIYAFEDLPRAIAEMQANTQTGIPIIRVAKDMPASVKGLVR